MKDPIGSFETIKENFIRYLKTAFGTKFEGIEKERYDLLNYDKVLYRKPWIEPLPDYISSGKKVNRNYEVTKDEGPRKGTSISALSKLRAVFANKGSVTAGNSSQMSDGAAFVMVMSEEMVK